MRISKLTVWNFRCFGPTPVEVNLDDLTVLIGSNGTGKTAALTALVKMFGARPSDRLIEFTDFHFPGGTDQAEINELKLWIEAVVEFPDPDAGQGQAGIAECFRHVAIDGPNGMLFCRIRLEAEWTRNGTSIGEVEQRMIWITSPDAEPPVAAKEEDVSKRAGKYRFDLCAGIP